MAQVITFEDYTPIARFDAVAWSSVRIEEAETSSGPWTQIDTIAISPLDADPTQPASRNFTTANASDDPLLWYRVIFVDAASDTEQPTAPIQNGGTTPYAAVDELARILKIRTPTTDQTAALERVLIAAAAEIDAEVDLDSDTVLTASQLAIAAQVNLDRAADLWRHTESIPGITGLLGDDGTVQFPGRYSWNRYAERLAPLKDQWGLA